MLTNVNFLFPPLFVESIRDVTYLLSGTKQLQYFPVLGLIQPVPVLIIKQMTNRMSKLVLNELVKQQDKSYPMVYLQKITP